MTGIMSYMWKRIKTEEIYRHPRLTLFRDEILLPSGEKSDYLHFEIENNATAIICQNSRGKILLFKEYSYLPGKKIYQLPGGQIKRGETPKQGALRELSEEAGVKANTLKFLGKYYWTHRRSKQMIHVFLGTDLEETAVEADPEEKGTIDKVWLTGAEVEKLIRNGEVVDADVLAIWSLYKSR